MTKTVMIVEDDFLIALSLQMILEARGWRVIGPAASVQAALRLLQDELPSAAVLDVNLGNEFVTPVAEALHERSVPFVVASAYEEPKRFGGQALAEAVNVGKPTNEGRLIAALDGLVGR